MGIILILIILFALCFYGQNRYYEKKVTKIVQESMKQPEKKQEINEEEKEKQEKIQTAFKNLMGYDENVAFRKRGEE